MNLAEHRLTVRKTYRSFSDEALELHMDRAITPGGINRQELIAERIRRGQSVGDATPAELSAAQLNEARS